MLRTVVKILKKHLDVGYASYEEMNEFLEISPYDILLTQPDYQQLKRLARELIQVMGSADIAKLVRIPSQAETKKMLKEITLIEVDEDYLDYHARYLRLWLAGLKPTIIEGKRISLVRTKPE